MSRNGGTERCTAFLANELSEYDDYNVFVADISNSEGDCYFDLNPNVNFTNFSFKNVFDGIIKTYKFLKSNHIDTIINIEAMLGIYTIFPSKFLKVKNIIWEHGNLSQVQCRSMNFVRKLEFKFCDYYITLTKSDGEKFEKKFKGKCKVFPIYNPIMLESDSSEYNINSKTIITVGVFRHVKGFDMIPDISKIVFEKHPDWCWHIYGNTQFDLEYTQELTKKINNLGLENNIIFKGTTPCLSDCYKASSLIVATSRMEGFSLTLLEGRTLKLPMIAFDVEEGPKEIIDNDINGYLIKPFDIEDMAEKICSLIENEQLRKYFSQNTQVGIEKFNKKSIIDKWLSII